MPPAVLSCIRLLSRVAIMAELSADQLASLFGDVLPVANKTREGAGMTRPPATPQVSNDRSKKAGTQERPPKFQRQQPKGSGRGKGKAQDKRPREDSAHSSHEDTRLEEQLIPMMAQLCLRFEDAINVLRLDRAYMMLFKTKGEESILRTLHDLSVRWEALQAAKQTECAKRIALFKGMILELQARAKSFIEQETKLQSLIQLGWVTKQDQREPMWQPLIWSVEQQKDIPCPDMGPLPHGKALQAMEMLIEHTNGQVIHRFHATRPLAQEYAGDMLEFKLEVSAKGQAPMQAHEALASLTNSSLWLLIGARMRPESLKRSALAKRVQQLLASGSWPWFCITRATHATKTPLCCPGCGPWFTPMRFRMGATAMRD